MEPNAKNSNETMPSEGTPAFVAVPAPPAPMAPAEEPAVTEEFITPPEPAPDVNAAIENADPAAGKAEPCEAPEKTEVTSPEASGEQAEANGDFPTVEEIREALEAVHDPEIGMSIIKLKLVYDIIPIPAEKKVDVKMTLTSPGCPLGPEMTSGVYIAVTSLKGVEDCNVELVWSPMWSPDMLDEETRLELGMW